MENIHIYPVGDVFEHTTKGIKCKCHPKIKREINSNIIIHNSFDCREVKEMDNQNVN